MRFPAVMAFVAALAVAPCSLAADDPLLPVVVSSAGPKAMRVRVAATWGSFFR
jgi:hypothetical protein